LVSAEPAPRSARVPAEAALADPNGEVPQALWLAGQVVDEHGAPLAGAKVLVSLADEHRRARSDEAGTFRVLGPPLDGETALTLSVVASDGDWDEGRHVTRAARSGELREPLVVPARTRVRWTVVGDVSAHGLGTGFRLQSTEDTKRPPSDPFLNGGVGLVYGLPPGRYDLVFTVWLGETLTSAPLASFELDAHERIELGPVHPDRALSPRRVVLTQGDEPLAAGVVVRVEAARPKGDPNQFVVSRDVRTDAGGAVTLPVPKGVAEVPELTFTVERLDAPTLVGRLAGVRGGETVVLAPETERDGAGEAASGDQVP